MPAASCAPMIRSRSTNSPTAERIGRPPSSTTCAPSSRYTRGRQSSVGATSRVISGTMTCAWKSVVITSVRGDQDQRSRDDEPGAQPDAGVDVLHVPAGDHGCEQQHCGYGEQVESEHHAHVGEVERQPAPPDGKRHEHARDQLEQASWMSRTCTFSSALLRSSAAET